jgi:uncharacterized membrane protein
MTGHPTPTAASPAAGASPKSGRFPFIDALRGLAVVFMMETHTVNALLDQGLKRGALFGALTYVNGLVAPAFLFCAGLGFAIFLGRKNDDVVRLGPASRAYLGKCLFIVFLGYSLHLPYFSLGTMLTSGREAWVAALQVDVLQVIGVTLILLLLLAVAVRPDRWRTAAAAVLTAVAVGWWYAVPATVADSLPDWARAYVSREHSPLFTIVPWAGFLTAGFLAGRRFAVESAAGRETETMRLFAVAAAVTVVAAGAASAFTGKLYPPGDFWYWSAEYFLLRLGSVGLVMCGLWFVLRKGGGRGARALELFGRESLPVYYIHLIIVYGKDFEWSFIRLFPGGSGYAFCAFLTAALCAGMYFYAAWWSSAKRSYPRAAAWAVRGVVAGSALSFILQ